MSKAELVAALHALRASAHDADVRAADQMALVHELEINQIELEMQNRELKEARQALEQSERRYSDLYNFAPIVYLTFDRAGKITGANLTAMSMLGVERSLIVGRPFASFVAMSQRPLFRAHLQRCLDDGNPARVDLQLAAGHEKPIPVEIISVPIRDDDGRIVGLRTTLTDISALKRAEERFGLLSAASRTLGGSIEEEATLDHALNAILRSLVPSVADLAFIDLVDGQGFRRLGSGTGLDGSEARRPGHRSAMRGLGPEGPQQQVLLSGEPILVSATPALSPSGGDQPEPEAVLRSAAADALLCVPLVSRDRKVGVLTLVSVSDSRRYTGADLTFATDMASRIAAAIDNHALYWAADAAIRAREDVLSCVAHDLRGLLHGIELSVEVLLGKAPPMERRNGWRQLERVQRAAVQMSRMIEEILDVGSVESATLELDLANLMVDYLALQTRELFAPAAAAKGISLEVRLVNEAILVRGDLTRVMRVFGNLVGNAIKFTSSGGSVTISSAIAGRHVLFSVRDTGVGVAPEHVPRLFDRYWQADATAGKGRGLGLYIAKHFVEAHGGTIWAESQLGVGTTMFFTLPRSSPADSGLPAPEAEVGLAAPGAGR